LLTDLSPLDEAQQAKQESLRGKARSLSNSHDGKPVMRTISISLVEAPPPIKLNVTFLVIFSAVTAAFTGSLQFGWAIGVVNNTKQPILDYFRDHSGSFDESLWPTAVAMWSAGGLLGGCVGGYCANYLGRKKTMLYNNLFFLLGNALMVFANGVGMFIAGRFIVGIGSGIATIVVPMYVAEISPPHIRGALGTLHQLLVTVGILVSQAIAITPLKDHWRWLYSIPVFLSLISTCLLPFIPESPSYMYSRGDTVMAVANLQRLRGTTDVAQEQQMMQDAVETAHAIEEISWKGLFTTRYLRRPLIIGIGLQFCQQISGINAIFTYSTDIFNKAGLSNADLMSVCVAVINVFLTLLALYLMDIAGRRILLLFGFAGMSLFYLVLMFCFKLVTFTNSSFVTVIATIGVVVGFAVGPGPVPWLIVAEIFPSACREKAMSVCIFMNWLMTLLVTLTFSDLLTALDKWSFFPFFGLCICFTVFCFVMVPETKGKTMEEINELFQGLDADEDKQSDATPLLTK